MLQKCFAYSATGNGGGKIFFRSISTLSLVVMRKAIRSFQSMTLTTLINPLLLAQASMDFDTKWLRMRISSASRSPSRRVTCSSTDARSDQSEWMARYCSGQAVDGLAIKII
jgi:hypothetical protein